MFYSEISEITPLCPSSEGTREREREREREKVNVLEVRERKLEDIPTNGLVQFRAQKLSRT
jgi:hypothetical protein